MRRREFIAGLAGAAVLPAGAGAEGAAQVVGYLYPGSRAEALERETVLSTALRRAGFDPGRDVTFEDRGAEGGYDRLPELAADLVRRKVSVILASAAAAAFAAKKATTDIPIVFTTGFDPVKLGLVPSFSRPDGNVTGIYLPFLAAEAKRLQILHQLVPTARTVGVLVNPGAPASALQEAKDALRGAAPALGLDLRFVEARTESDLVPAFERFAADRVDAVFEATDVLVNGVWTDRIVALAAAHRLPVVGVETARAAAGLLACYGADLDEGYAQAATYVARILKGAKPADLPVMQTTKFSLVINLKTAKALGIEVPPLLLTGADQVIE